MVKQYPHTITVTIKTGSSKVSGNWQPGTEITTDKNCRYEPNKGNGVIAAADGTQINYDGIVYMPLPQTYLQPGTEVEVKDGATVLLKGTVKQCSIGQLNARLWL